MIEESHIEEKQKDLIKYLEAMIGVSDCLARALLLKFMWSKEDVM